MNGVYDFRAAKSWIEFMSLFTSDKFLINNNHIMKLIFSQLDMKMVTTQLGVIFLTEIQQYLLDEFSVEDDDYVLVNSNELVFEFAHLDDLMSAELKRRFGDKINVEAFTLHRIDPMEFYVKEHSNEKIEFKAIPPSFICQAIKKYRKKEVKDADLTFIHNGMVAVYRDKIFG